jgi:diamine N-acetyltransferase
MHTATWPPGLCGAILEKQFPWIATMRQESAAPFPSKASPVSLREITPQNVRIICLLDVADDQRGLVAPNALSIAQAYVHPVAWPRAIYAGEIPVGFAMLEDHALAPDAAPEHFEGAPYVGLWRFMIDARFQQHGFGKHALNLLIAHARTRPDAANMLLSFVPAEKNPEPFYRRFGFEPTGEIDDGEVVMRLRLR